MRERKSYSKEFKKEAVRLAEQTGNISQTARDLGVHLSLLRAWKKQVKAQSAKILDFG